MKIFRRKLWLIIALAIICGLGIAIIVSINKSDSQYLSIEQALVLGPNNLDCNVWLEEHHIKGDTLDRQNALHLITYLNARKSLTDYWLSWPWFLAPLGVSLIASDETFCLIDTKNNNKLCFAFYFGMTGYGVFEINDDISRSCDKHATDKIIEFLIYLYQKYNIEMPLYLSKYLTDKSQISQPKSEEIKPNGESAKKQEK